MRFLSAAFARETAEVLAAAGIPVWLADAGTPTPAVSYAVVARKTAGAVMITASHNPYRWNGIKFKAPYGGSADPAIITRIESHSASPRSSWRAAAGGYPAAVEIVDLTTPYLERLKQLVKSGPDSRLRPEVRHRSHVWGGQRLHCALVQRGGNSLPRNSLPSTIRYSPA